jgi:phosphohistidine phosphatase
MQRKVVLMRHGHAEQASDDFSRALSRVGVSQARAAGTALAAAGFEFDLVLTSSAPRALATAECVAGACNYGGAIRSDRSLYLAPEGHCLKALRELPGDVGNVLFVGHNPGLSALVGQLTGHTRELAPAEYVSAVFELEDWSQLD